MKVFKHFTKTILCLVLFLAITVAVLHYGYGSFLKAAYPLHYEEIVMKEANENDLDPALVYAVIKAESNFESDARSHAGAVGLMQLTPDTFKWLQTKTDDVAYETQDLYKPEVNVGYGCKFLQILLKKYASVETALCAYNAGMGTVNSWLDSPDISQDGVSLQKIPYRETREYVSVVMKNYKKYSEIYQFEQGGYKNAK